MTVAEQLDTIRDLAHDLYGGRAETVDRDGYGFYRMDDFEYGAEFFARPLTSLSSDEAFKTRRELGRQVADYADSPGADPDIVEMNGFAIRL
ncbi:hypothetical protein ACFVIM_34040 [Streptomyces sp. NPDC057638]|uniref:hypothetical protein n=1 Tax=Streptomyces sp. NPDC057638 TaxID=3346190 RepID=UPI003692EBE6